MPEITARNVSKLMPAAVLLLAALVFLPSLGNGLVGWDDRVITETPLSLDLSPGSIFRMFVPAEGFSSSYQPLRSLLVSVVFTLSGGANLKAFLLVNLLLYLLNVFLFFVFAAQLTGNDWRSAPVGAVAAALIFAVHPVHVEVVSWHQGSKVTLMAAFFLLSIISYIHFRRSGGERYYWLCLVSFVAALLSQPIAVALPLVLVCWEAVYGNAQVGNAKNKQGKNPWLRLVPFFLPAAALAFQLLFLSTVRLSEQSSAEVLNRVAFLPVVWGESLQKLLLPVNLCARYPIIAPDTLPWMPILGWSAMLVAAGWCALKLAGNSRHGVFAILLFVCTILPTSGLVQTSTLIADRYLYLPGMAVILAAGAGIGRLAERPGLLSLGPRAGLAMLVMLACLSSISLAREYDWRNRVSLWGRVVEIYPDHAMAQFNLADAWSARGEQDKAVEHYWKSLELNPQYGGTYANLSTIMLHQGRTDLARTLISKAVELLPGQGEVWIKRGIIMASTGDDSSAVESFERAIEIDGNWAWAGHFNLGMMYLGWGDDDAAKEHLTRALELLRRRPVPGRVEDDIRSALDGINRAAAREKR